MRKEYNTGLDFCKLPLETRIDILVDLAMFDETHVEYWEKEHKYVVTPDFCLCANEYEKPKITHYFHKKDFAPEAIKMGVLLKFGSDN